MANDKFVIERFDGKDFGYWKMQMEDYLYQKNLYLPLEGISKKPITLTDAEWAVLDRQALGAVRLSLARNVAYNVKDEKTTVGLMKALENVYEKPSATNKAYEYDLDSLTVMENEASILVNCYTKGAKAPVRSSTKGLQAYSGMLMHFAGKDAVTNKSL